MKSACLTKFSIYLNCIATTSTVVLVVILCREVEPKLTYKNNCDQTAITRFLN